MKSELKAKFLQHLIANRDEKGFTLIELLVVIIIIGILAAIALPSFLNQANKAKQSEAKTYVGSVNRAQQAYYVENSKWGTTTTELGIGIPTSTDNYTYTIGGGATATSATVSATPASNALLGYGGIAWIEGTGAETTSKALLCTGDAGKLPTIATDCT